MDTPIRSVNPTKLRPILQRSSELNLRKGPILQRWSELNFSRGEEERGKRREGEKEMLGRVSGLIGSMMGVNTKLRT